MEFILTFLAVALITTTCLTFLTFAIGTVLTTVVREKARAESHRWHPSENVD